MISSNWVANSDIHVLQFVKVHLNESWPYFSIKFVKKSLKKIFFGCKNYKTVQHLSSA